MTIPEELGKIDLFSICTKPDLEIIGRHLQIRHTKEGDVIAREGDTPQELFFIIDGVVSGTSKLPNSAKRKNRDYPAGSFFGVASVFGKKPLSDTYIASEAGTIVIIREEGFTELIESNPSTAILLFSMLLGKTVSEFRKTSTFLADVVQWGENASRRVITDEMTGVYNRAFLDDAIENFFNRLVSYLTI